MLLVTAVIAPASLFCLVGGTYSIIDDWLHSRPNFPLPSLAPEYVAGSVVLHVLLGLLWRFYFTFSASEDL